MRMRILFTCLTLVIILSAFAFSQYSATESFIYRATTSADTLLGTTGNGWTNGWWKENGTLGLGAISDSANLHYGDLSYAALNIGNHLTVTLPGGWTASRYERLLDQAWPNTAGTSYWVSFLFEANVVPIGNTYYCLKLFYNNSEICGLGKGGGGTAYTCGSGWPSEGSEDRSTVECAGTPVRIVARFVMEGSGIEARTFMWIDPDPASEPDTNVADVKRWTTMDNGFNNVRIENGGELANSLNYDEIRIGDSWTSVSSAQYWAIESFKYASQSNPDTLLGVTGDGWTDGWWKENGTLLLGKVTDTANLHYGDLSYSIANIGNHLMVTLPGGWTASRYERLLDKAWPNTAGTSYWVSFLFEANVVPTGNTYYCLKLFYNNSEICGLGKGGGGTAYTCGSGWPSEGSEDRSTVECAGTPIWMVARFVMEGSGTEARTFMWVDPDPASEPDTNVADVKRWTTMDNGFNNVRIENGGELANMLNYDEVRIGTDFAAVSLPMAPPTSVGPGLRNGPTQFELAQNHPNPFNPSTIISYTLKNSGMVRLAVYDILGRQVAVLMNGVQTAGPHQVTFSGENLTSGIYFYRLENAGMSISKKMILLK